MRIFFLLSIVFFSVSSFSQSLYGTWKCAMEGYTMIVQLNPDGTGKLDGENISFKASNGKITITEADGEVTTYSYAINGNKMTVSGGDIEGSLVFTKEAPGGLGTKASQKTSAAATPLQGSWTGATGTFTFNNGNGTANGQPFKYSTAGNQITMTDNQGTFVFTYSISGNNLQLEGYGRTLNFSKSGTGTSASATTKSSKGAELTGKWCYLTSNYNSLYNQSNSSFTDECFTLNGDGTYSYHFEANRSASGAGTFGYSNTSDSDQGTWSFDGVSKITVKSNKGTTAVYTIEKKNHPKTGDPMLFVDGRGFVTFYKKSPW